MTRIRRAVIVALALALSAAPVTAQDPNG